MKVFNFDENCYLIGITELDDSDKCQITGDWLIPGNSTEKEPIIKEGYLTKFDGTDWINERILTTEEKKINGDLSLEDGEIISDNQLTKVEKPSDYHVWNSSEWVYSSELRKSEIYTELDSIDTQTVRPLRAILSGLGTDWDKAKLAELETQAKKLRTELASL